MTLRLRVWHGRYIVIYMIEIGNDAVFKPLLRVPIVSEHAYSTRCELVCQSPDNRSRWVCRRVVNEDENASTCKGHKSEAQTLPIGRNPIVGQDYIGEWLVQE